MNFKGNLFNQKKGVFTRLLSPLLLVMQIFQIFQDFIHHLAWSELIYGKTPKSSSLQSLVFVTFCLLSLVEFFWGIHVGLFILGFGIYAIVEKIIIQRYYKQQGGRVQVTLSCQNRHCYWKEHYPNGQIRQKQMPPATIHQVFLQLITVRGGLLDQEITQVWQVFLRLTDKTDLRISEDVDASTAWRKANYLANSLNIPLTVLSSKGKGPHAASQFLPIRGASISKFVTKKTTSRGGCIYTQWTLRNSWKLLGQAFHEAGFLLFITLLSEFMETFGEMLASIVGIHSSNYLSDVLTLFLVSPNSWDLLLIGVAVGLIVVQGIRISQSKLIHIHTNQLKIVFNKQVRINWPLDSIQSIILLRQPVPLIAICSTMGMTTIEHLLDDSDYRTMMMYLEESLPELA